MGLLGPRLSFWPKKLPEIACSPPMAAPDVRDRCVCQQPGDCCRLQEVPPLENLSAGTGFDLGHLCSALTGTCEVLRECPPEPGQKENHRAIAKPA